MHAGRRTPPRLMSLWMNRRSSASARCAPGGSMPSSGATAKGPEQHQPSIQSHETNSLQPVKFFKNRACMYCTYARYIPQQHALLAPTVQVARGGTCSIPHAFVVEPGGLHDSALAELLQPEVVLRGGVGPQRIAPRGGVRLAHKAAAEKCLGWRRERCCKLHADTLWQHDVICIC